MFNIFEIDHKSVAKSLEAPSAKSVIYAPKAVNGTNGKHTSIIRLLPNPNDPLKSSIPVVRYYIEHGGLKQYVKSDASYTCPMSKTFYELRDKGLAGDAIAAKKSKQLSRNRQWYSYAYVVSDSTNPAMKGKFVIYEYNIDVQKMILKSKETEMVGGEVVTQGIEAFNVVGGCNLYLSLTTKSGSENWTDYTGVKFLSVSEMVYEDSSVTKVGKEFQEKFVEFAEANPLEDRGYVQEKESVMKMVHIFLDSLTGRTTVKDSTSTNPFEKADGAVKKAKPAKATKTEQPVVEPPDDDDDDDDDVLGDFESLLADLDNDA